VDERDNGGRIQGGGFPRSEEARASSSTISPFIQPFLLALFADLTARPALHARREPPSKRSAYVLVVQRERKPTLGVPRGQTSSQKLRYVGRSAAAHPGHLLTRETHASLLNQRRNRPPTPTEERTIFLPFSNAAGSFPFVGSRPARWMRPTRYRATRGKIRSKIIARKTHPLGDVIRAVPRSFFTVLF